jgi:uncharacterized membrane protein YdjX (TVP38/TMEM64 family)
VLGIIVVAAVAWVYRHELHGFVLDVKAWVADLGVWGKLIFVAAFVVLTCVMAPDSLLSIAAGAAFGFVGGMAVVLVGIAIARAVQYALARRVLQQRVTQYIATRPRLAAIERAVRDDQLRLQFLIRLTPMSPTLVSYLFGAAGVRFGGFMLALIAILPAYFVYVYIGVESTHVVEMSARTEGGIGFTDILKIGGLVASVIVMVVIARTAVRAVNRAAAAHEAGEAHA